MIWVRVTNSLPSDGDGPIAWCISVVEDITKRKNAEEAARHATEDLKRSNEDLGQFAYIASHDLQEPLRAVAGFMGIIKRRYEDKLDDDAREFIGHAVEGAERMKALINDLLTFSRVGTKGGAFKPMDMRAALDGALNNLTMAIAESNALITCDDMPHYHRRCNPDDATSAKPNRQRHQIQGAIAA